MAHELGISLLIPGGIMPDAIRRAHLVKVTSSNFLFGWIVVWVLNRHHNSWRDLFQRSAKLDKAKASL